MQSQKQTVISDAAPKKRRSIGIYTGKGKKVLFNIKDRISGTLFTEFAIKKSETVFTIFEEEHPFLGTWSHYLQLMRIENEDERSFYEIEAAREKSGADADVYFERNDVIKAYVICNHLANEEYANVSWRIKDTG